MELANTRVVVTGGAGFIGSWVVDQLVAADNEVVVVDDFSTGRMGNLEHHAHDPRVRIVEADIRDLDAMRDVVRDTELVLHMAVASLRVSLSDPALVHEVNATGTLNVCRAAQENGVRRIAYVSSSEAYGSAATAPMDERHPLLPTTVYGASKAAGELYSMAFLRTYGTEVTVIRPFNTYGPREHSEGTSAEVIPKFTMWALAGRAPVIFGDGGQTRDFTWVEDTARGIIAAAASDALVGQEVNVARGEEVSIGEIARLVLEATGRADLVPEWQPDRPGDVRRHFADITKARSVLAFEPTVDIATGIGRYVEWVREQKPDLDAWLRAERVRNW